MKLVLITGASRGIGARMAQLFSQNGYYVAINYNKSIKSAKDLSCSIQNTQAFKADISNFFEVESMFCEINNSFGKMPDILINNAAVSQQKLFCDTTEEEYDLMFDINVKGTFLCTKFALPAMINRKQGKIINISSMWGQIGASCEVTYSASKAAIIGFTKALAKEIGPSGIQVNCIAPGVIKTDMLNSFSTETLNELAEETPLGRIGTPDDIANTALFLAGDKSDFITGQIIGVNGGFVI